MHNFKRSLSLFSKNEIVSRAMVSSAHPISHIRQYKVPQHDSELPQEKDLREFTYDIHRFVNEFWTSNNKQYQSEKAAFESKLLQTQGAVNPEEMTPFYIDFLERSKTRHAEFHKTYVKMSFKLVMMTLSTNLLRVYQRLAGFRSPLLLASKSQSRQT